MTNFNSQGLRGTVLEEMINRTNEKYRMKGLALVQKIPTPINPIKMDEQRVKITLAYFEKKSTVDYMGVVQGVPVCFDAKECRVSSSFPLHNVAEHQVKFMEDFENQQGKAFLLIYFIPLQKFYYLNIRQLKKFWDRAKEGGRKSIRIEELEPEYFFQSENGYLVPYLVPLSRDLEING